MPLVASRKESTAPACPCSPGPFILTTLRCTPPQPKLIELGAHTFLTRPHLPFYATPSSDSPIVQSGVGSLRTVPRTRAKINLTSSRKNDISQQP